MSEEKSEAAPTVMLDDLEEWIAASMALARDSEQCLLATVDADGCLAISTRGFDVGDVPNALHRMAEALERDARKAKVTHKIDVLAAAIAAQRAWNELPDDHKAKCPACSKQVALLHESILDAIGQITICSCGAFLFLLLDEHGKIMLRLMNDTEVAALDADVRERLMRTRETLAAALGKKMPNNAH